MSVSREGGVPVKTKSVFAFFLVLLLFVFSCSDDETAPVAPTVESYIVAFDTMGGSCIFPQMVEKSGTVTQPANPVREGWSFAGWYRDRECTTAWVYSTDTISAETTIFAKWTGGPISGDLSVTFDTLGGSGIGTQFVAAGGLVTQPVMYPDKTGYVFVGWYKETNGITAWDFANDTVSEATTIYAKWAVTPLTCRTNSGIEISKCLTTVSGHINIPNYIAGKPVVRIGKNAFTSCVNLRSISFPPYLHTIDQAGLGGTGLYSVVVPECVTELAVWAFMSCADLTNIVLPQGLTKIGTMTFGGCSALANISIPETVTEIQAYAFKECVALTNIIIPEAVQLVDSRVFQGCTQLRAVTWPTNCKSIGMEAFKNCVSLTALSIPASITNIGDNAFNGCTSLKTFNMHPAVAPAVGVYAFYNVTGCDLHYPTSGSGYGVNPWSDTSIFSTASGDL